MATKRKSKDEGRTFKTRIVGHAELDPKKIKAHAQNWRIHPDVQRAVLGGVLEGVGWIRPVIVNKRTGNLLDGHLRVDLCIEKGEPVVPVDYVDLSEDEERQILATLDPIAGLAVMDGVAFAKLTDGLRFETEAMRSFVNDLKIQAGEMVIQPITAEALGLPREGAGSSPGRSLTIHAVVKVALPVSTIETLERALQATGCSRRDEALKAICASYLDGLGLTA